MIYMMMLPRRNEFNLLDDIFGDLNYAENKIMKTDIKEHKNHYSIMVDLPGYNKDDIKISIEDGYLTISATMKKKEMANLLDVKDILANVQEVSMLAMMLK